MVSCVTSTVCEMTNSGVNAAVEAAALSEVVPGDEQMDEIK